MVMQLTDVSVKRGDKTVLHDISGTFEFGHTYSLLGPNGAGKSTLLHAVTKLMPFEGNVRLDDMSLSHFNAEQLAQRITYLPQNIQTLFPLTVSEVVALGALPHTLTRMAQRKAVKNVLAQWELTAFADVDARRLSGGQQQRCQLARTHLQLLLMDTPGYWILDEPTASLDLQHQRLLIELMADATAKGHGVITVVHDLNLATRLASDIWLLKDGEKIVAGSPDDILSSQRLQQVFNASIDCLNNPHGHNAFIFSE